MLGFSKQHTICKSCKLIKPYEKGATQDVRSHYGGNLGAD